MKILDIKTDLEKDVDLRKEKKSQWIKINSLYDKEWVIVDIKKWLKNLDLSLNKYVKIIKNNTKNFDWATKWKKLKIIKLSKKDYKKVLSKHSKNVLKVKEIISLHFLKQLWLIFLVLIILLYVDKIAIEYNINSWYNKLTSIKDSKSFEDIQLNVNNAKFNFIIWNILFKPLSLIPSESIENANHVIIWWKYLTKIWDDWIKLYSEVNSFIDWKWLENIYFSNLLFNLKDNLIDIETWLNNVIYNYRKVKNLKWDLKDKFYKWLSLLEEGNKLLNIVNSNYDSLLSILWHENVRSYLIVFQNNDEIRPTWWFMWSMAIVKIYKWKIVSFDTNDVYAHEWDLKKSDFERIPAPKWINTLTDTFWLRDSNYYVDINKSSENIKFFINEAWIEIDWILYINKNTLLKLLEITWEIEMNDIWEKITSENFSRIMSTLVEAKLFKVWTLWTPKQILFDFIWEFKKKVLSDKNYLSYLKLIHNEFISRDIMFYSFKWNENKFLWDLWINWNINFENKIDFSYPVYTSISWNKSDRYIQRSYSKKISIQNDCQINTNLKITSKHLFTKAEEKNILDLLNKYWIEDKQKSLYIQWASDNKQYVRILLPKNAIVEKSSNYEIMNTNNYMVVDFFHSTRKNEITEFNLNYIIPNNECKKYDFTFYKQAWIPTYDLKIEHNSNILQKNWIEWDFIYSIDK